MSRTLFVVDHLDKGGAEQITLSLAGALAGQGHRISLATLNAGRDAHAVPDGVKRHDLDLWPVLAFGKFWKPKQPDPAELARYQTLLDEGFNVIVLGFLNGYWLAAGHRAKSGTGFTATFWSGGPAWAFGGVSRNGHASCDIVGSLSGFLAGAICWW